MIHNDLAGWASLDDKEFLKVLCLEIAHHHTYYNIVEYHFAVDTAILNNNEEYTRPRISSSPAYSSRESNEVSRPQVRSKIGQFVVHTKLF